ncbi:MAG: DUF1595 domain-containing protein, partial [Pseudomonadales bacterium]|nr:DUF1595 domain-containing protein [Pseudomonadales bacterium]
MFTSHSEIRPKIRSKMRQALIGGICCAALVGCGQQNVETFEPADSGSLVRTRLLTDTQYSNTITHIFGADISDSVLPPIPPMERTDGLLASGAAFVGVTSDQISQIQLAAARIAEQVVDEEHRDFLIPCRPESLTTADSACAGLFLSETGRLLLRRPLTDSHLAELVDVAGYAANETEDFYNGLALALEAILISPEFVFILESAE